MEHFRIRPLREVDIDEIIAATSGVRAHVDADRRDRQGADYLLGESLIELKALDEEGLEKCARQAKIAALFHQHKKNRRVIVLDRESLPEHARRDYDRILEGPIKGAVSSARKQLKQSRAELTESCVSILFVVNNGYTALDHSALLKMIVHRVRNDTAEIDGVVVAGCYYYSDSFDSFFLWPIDYVPINVRRTFTSFEKLRTAWNEYAGKFMTTVVRGQLGENLTKGPIVDTQFDVDGVTYVKPAPPIGKESEFFGKTRPRNDSSGLTHCPPVAVTFPDMTRDEWMLFRQALPGDASLYNTYDEWQARRRVAAASGTALKPFVPMTVSCQEWDHWRDERKADRCMSSVRQYANELFDNKVRSIILSAHERLPSSLVPSRYLLAVTEEIGQDRANDVSHIAVISEVQNTGQIVEDLAVHARVFHEHAIAIAGAHAVCKGIECVMWEKDLRYAWV